MLLKYAKCCEGFPHLRGGGEAEIRGEAASVAAETIATQLGHTIKVERS